MPYVQWTVRLLALNTGGSIDLVRRLMNGLFNVAVNWAGGLHHAKKAQVSGFST